MIQSARQWFRRNRTNFAIGAGVVGAGYLATQYVLGKVTEARQRMSDERIAKENLRRRFEQNQEDCTFTVLAILPTAAENIIERLPVEQTLGELQKQKADRLAKSSGPSDVSTADQLSAPPSVTDEDGKSLASIRSESFVHTSQMGDSSAGDGSLRPPHPLRSKRSKAAMWNEMKISSIARAFAMIYTLGLLTLLTRIQLNLLGRRNYLASVVSLASPKQDEKIKLENRDDDNFENAYGNDFVTNRKFLSLSWWLLHKGCRNIVDAVVAAVEEVFGSLNPREDITLEKLSELTVAVRKKVEGVTEEDRRKKQWLPFLLPPVEEEDYALRESGMTGPSEASASSSPSLRRLIDETSDLIDSPSFAHVLTLLLDAAFTVLIDTKIATLAYKLPPTSASSARVQEIIGTDAKAKVASTLAVFCRQAHMIGSGSTNEYLAAMESVRDLEAFAAVVYSSNFEFETLDFGPLTACSATEPLTDTPTRPGTSNLATPAGFRWGKDPEDPMPLDGNGVLMGEADLEKAWRKHGPSAEGTG